MNKYKINRTCRILILVLLANLLLAAVTMAGPSTHTEQGIVTKAPWQDRYVHIEIDNKLYTFMPDATFTIVITNRQGNHNQEWIRWQQIKKGQSALIDIQGRRIYRLLIFK